MDHSRITYVQWRNQRIKPQANHCTYPANDIGKSCTNVKYNIWEITVLMAEDKLSNSRIHRSKMSRIYSGFWVKYWRKQTWMDGWKPCTTCIVLTAITRFCNFISWRFISPGQLCMTSNWVRIYQEEKKTLIVWASPLNFENLWSQVWRL